MKKTSFLLGAAFLLSCTFGLQSCSVDDNPVSDPVLPFSNGDDLSLAISSTLANGETTVVLPAGIELTLNEPIEVSEAIEIVGDEENPAKITAKNGLIVSSAIKISNVEIDATELASPLVQLAAAEEVQEIGEIELANATVKGLSQSLIKTAGKGVKVNNYVVDNSVIEVVKDVTVFDFTKGSTAINFTVQNSTLYATVSTSKSLYSSQGGQKATELDANATQTFSFLNSTVFNFAVSKNFFSHRQSNQTWLAYTVKNSIFLDCGKSGQVIRGMNGGQSGKNPTWTIDHNSFQFTTDGVITDTAATEDTNDAEEPVQNNVEGIVVFADAANGDFTLGECPQKEAQIGDPRWLQ